MEREIFMHGECGKCGAFCAEPVVTTEQTYDAVLKRWTESRRTVTASISTTYVKLATNANCLCGRTDGREHLHRKCMVCGFYWSEETIESLVGSNE